MVIEDLKILKKRLLVVVVIIFVAISIFRIYNNISLYSKNKVNQKNTIFKQTSYIYNAKINIINRSFASRLESIVSQQKIKDAIKNLDRKTLYNISIKRFKTIKKDFPTLTRMHYHLPNYTSLLRVHKTEKFADNLKEKRPMITKTIQTKTMQIGFESGVYDNEDITYRVVIPILDGDVLLAVVELGIDIKGILYKIDDFFKASRMQKVYMGFLLQNKNFTDNKINHNINLTDYKLIGNDKLVTSMINNIDSSKLEQNIKFNNKDYFIFWGKEKLNDFNKNQIGTIFYAFDITKLENDFRKNTILSIVQPIVGMIVLFLILLWLFNYIIKQSKLNNIKVTSIVDNQKAIIVVTNGKNIIQINNSFLKFFNIDNLKLFLKDYDCICDKFEKKDGYLQKQYGDKTWIEFMMLNPSRSHKAEIITENNNSHIFQVNAKEFKQGNDIEYVVSFDDITDLEDVNKNLEKVVYEKTKELSNANEDLKTINQKLKIKTIEVENESKKVHYLNVNLKKDITQAIKDNRYKEQQLFQQSRLAQMGEMISMIAHQWRQPLTAISATSAGISLKAKLHKLDENIAIELADKISNYAQHLSSTIDDFREFFKSNKEKKEITFNELVNGVLNIVKDSITNKNIELITKLNCNHKLNTYPNEIKQVILNLIKNSEDILIEKDIKNPVITIETKCDLDFKSPILMIKDNGGGIPDDISSQIFDPYFSTKTEKNGTGLGLYMSKTIIEEHCNGELSVSNDKYGAVFTIKLKGEDI